MRDPYANVSIAVTYIGHGDKWFSVSTIDRASSAALAYGRRYSETIVWEWDQKTRERGRMLWQGSGSEGCIRTHQATVERIHATGSPDEPEEHSND